MHFYSILNPFGLLLHQFSQPVGSPWAPFGLPGGVLGGGPQNVNEKPVFLEPFMLRFGTIVRANVV